MTELLLKGAYMAEEKTDELSYEEGDEPISAEEADERAKFREEVLEDLEVLKRREITISSTAYPGQTRKYYVEDMDNVYVDGKRGKISVIRFINKNIPEYNWPKFKYPTDSIRRRKEGTETIYSLVYSYEPSVLHSFRHIYKKNKPDMCIYIRFTE